MIIKFNSDTGLMYIHFSSGVPNIQMPTKNEDISKFVAKANKEQVIGYEIEAAEANMNFILNKLGLNRKQKLAISMCFIREKQKKTQKEFSTIINVSEGTYKSIERAEHNISFDTLDVIYNQFKSEPVLHQVFA
jgi:DNA-binding XRE family transcriptional regulator